VPNDLYARAVLSFELVCIYREWGGKVLVELKENVAKKGLTYQGSNLTTDLVVVDAKWKSLNDMIDQKVAKSTKVDALHEPVQSRV